MKEQNGWNLKDPISWLNPASKNTLPWVGRRPGMGDALKNLIPSHRDRLIIVIQSYDHTGFWLRRSVEKALRELKKDYADIFFLGWFNSMPGGRLLDTARKLKEEQPLTTAVCYRFALSHPAVDLCLAGPRTAQEMDEGLEAPIDGPLNLEEMTRIRTIGDHVHG